MEEWADGTSTCLGCTPGFPSTPHTPCGGTGAMPGMPSPRDAGRAHLQDIRPFVDLTSARQFLFDLYG